MKTYTTDALPNQLTAFLRDYSRVYRAILVDAVNLRLAGERDKSKLNTLLQQAHQINKRHANAAITEADAMITAAQKSRKLHLKQLEGRLKSAREWLKKAEKKLKNARKFYGKKDWQHSKTGCPFPLATFLDTRQTNWQSLRFRLHHKRRYAAHLERQIVALKTSPLRVSVPRNAGVYFVGSKDETLGNQVCQFDGTTLRIRVPNSCVKPVEKC